MAGVIGSEAVFQVTGNDGRYLLISVAYVIFLQ